jgi:hypothetical protein
LVRVRELRAFRNIAPLAASDMARVLHAAPHLRTFFVQEEIFGDPAWFTAPAHPLHPAFVGLVHPRLRHFGVNMPIASLRGDDCMSRLRQTCFPALRELEVSAERFFVTPLCAP